jgi:nucleoside-diphosphate-sugar epimerase
MPVEAYGRSKLQAEQAVVRYRDLLDVTIVRPAAVYGPRDRDFLAAFRQAASRVALHAAPRDHQFSCVHVDDLVRALLLAAAHPAAIGRTFFVAAEQPVTWRQLYDAIAEAAGTRPLQVQLPLSALRLAAHGADLMGAITGRVTLLNRNKAALARRRWWLCDPSAIREALGWRAEVTLQDGVRNAYLWYVDAGWLRHPGPAASAVPPGESQA